MATPSLKSQTYTKCARTPYRKGQYAHRTEFFVEDRGNNIDTTQFYCGRNQGKKSVTLLASKDGVSYVHENLSIRCVQDKDVVNTEERQRIISFTDSSINNVHIYYKPVFQFQGFMCGEGKIEIQMADNSSHYFCGIYVSQLTETAEIIYKSLLKLQTPLPPPPLSTLPHATDVTDGGEAQEDDDDDDAVDSDSDDATLQKGDNPLDDDGSIFGSADVTVASESLTGYAEKKSSSPPKKKKKNFQDSDRDSQERSSERNCYSWHVRFVHDRICHFHVF